MERLTGAQKRAVVLAGTAQFVLMAAALLDVYRRPGEDVRRNKLLWTTASFVNFAGPLSYFLFRRKR